MSIVSCQLERKKVFYSWSTALCLDEARPALSLLCSLSLSLFISPQADFRVDSASQEFNNVSITDTHFIGVLCECYWKFNRTPINLQNAYQKLINLFTPGKKNKYFGRTPRTSVTARFLLSFSKSVSSNFLLLRYFVFCGFKFSKAFLASMIQK